jgi:hypothetical protein
MPFGIQTDGLVPDHIIKWPFLACPLELGAIHGCTWETAGFRTDQI